MAHELVKTFSAKNFGKSWSLDLESHSTLTIGTLSATLSKPLVPEVLIFGGLSPKRAQAAPVLRLLCSLRLAPRQALGTAPGCGLACCFDCYVIFVSISVGGLVLPSCVAQLSMCHRPVRWPMLALFPSLCRCVLADYFRLWLDACISRFYCYRVAAKLAAYAC